MNTCEKLVVLVGSNGMGKSSTAKAFMQRHKKCEYIDLEACRAINLFSFTPATKKAVKEALWIYEMKLSEEL